MRSGVGPFRELRTGRAFLLMWRADPNEFHRYWPSLAEKEEAEFKRLELISWKDEVRSDLFRGRSGWPAGRRNDVGYQYSRSVTDKAVFNVSGRARAGSCSVPSHPSSPAPSTAAEPA